MKYCKGRAKFECGWMGFMRDNNLKAGDVCVFVFINNNIKPLIDVVYFRTTEAENCTTDGEQTEPETKETDEDDDSDSGYDPSDDTFSPSEEFDDDSDDDSSETPESFTSYQRKPREKSPLTSPQPRKEKGTIFSGKAETDINYTMWFHVLIT